LLTIAAGFASAAGYQVIARSTRPPGAFRGPSPPLLLGIQLVLSIGLGLAWVALGLPDPATSAIGFLVISITLLSTYFLVVWLFGIRTGAVTWADLGIPQPLTASRIGEDLAVGVAAGALVWPVAIGLSAILVALLNSRPPEVIPPVQSAGEVLLTVVGAAILVPVGEELLFRGYALTAWWRDRGPRSALVRSTLFFAFAHIIGVTAATFDDGVRQALLTVVVITPVGVALGLVFMRRGLIASITAHATFNLISTLLVALAQLLPELPPSG
jgi:membrane protease YdiL (CAAX protease family)